MRKRLVAYSVNGQTVGVDLDQWYVDDLNGNSPFLIISFDDVIPVGYVDINTIFNWDVFGISVANDYLVCRDAIRDIVVDVGWENLTDAEKDLAIKYNAYGNPMDAVIHLMVVKGMAQQDAEKFLIGSWHRHHGEVVNSCVQRWYYVKLIVPMFLSFTDAEDLLNGIDSLIFAFTSMGRHGINYGDKKDGLMDYIESTNGFQGKGLRESGYTLLRGTWDDFILQLKNVLVYGIYNKYEDFELL